MTLRDAAPGRAPILILAQSAAIAGIALLLGFLLLPAAPVAAAFHGIAELLAITATAVLRVLGYAIMRTGTELRDSVSGHAIVVTEACDGSSLVVAMIAVAALLWPGTLRDTTLLAVSALIAIIAFNLLRVVLLFVSIGVPAVMNAQHLYAAPLLSAVLVGGLAIVGLRLSLREIFRTPLLWVGVAIIASVAWYLVAEALTCAIVVPLANTLLWFIPGELERAILCGAPGASVATSAVIGYDPVRVLDVPFHPADFTLAFPLVAASLALARQVRIVALGAMITLVLFAAAMAVGSMTASHDAAETASVTLLIGEAFSMPFSPIGDLGLGLLKAAQNALVHFNLFVLPLALAEAASIPPSAARRAPPGRTSRARGGRRMR